MSINTYNKLIFGKYKLLDILGKGSFGFVFRAKNILTGEDVAIKIEDWKKQGNILQGEAYFLFYLKGIGIPEVKSFGVFDKYKILVETLLGDSIESIFSRMNYNFTVKDICMILIQLLDRLEFVHSKYIIHRDIKPENIMVDYQTKRIVYLIDFGLAKKYRSTRTGRHIKFTIPKRLTGTARYASVNALRGTEQSRRDDLESLAYILIYFANRGYLPWQGLNIADKIERYRRIYYIKKDIKLEDLCKGMEHEFFEFVKYVKHLQFEEDPDYNYLKGLFMKVLNRKNLCVDYNFSWLNHQEINKSITNKNFDCKKVRHNSLSKRKKSLKARILRNIQTRISKNIQTSKERENNLKEIKENILINELEKKQEQREKEYILKKEKEKEKNKLDLDVNNLSMDGTQMAIFNLSLNVEDIDEEAKIKNNKTNIKYYNNIKKKTLSEKENAQNIRTNKGKKMNNNTLKNRPIIFNLSNGSFNNATLVRCLSQYNIKINNLIEKTYNSRNNRISIKGPTLTEEYIENNMISKNKEKNINKENKNKNKSKENNNIKIINQKSRSPNISDIISPEKTENKNYKSKVLKINFNMNNELNNKEIINKIKNSDKIDKNNTLSSINNYNNIKMYESPIKNMKNNEYYKVNKQINALKVIKLKQNLNNTNYLPHNNISRNPKRKNFNHINDISNIKNINNINLNNGKITNAKNTQGNYNFSNNKRIKNEERMYIRNIINSQKTIYANNLSNRNKISPYKNNVRILINQSSQPNILRNKYKLSNNFNKISKNKIEIKSLENEIHSTRNITSQGISLNRLYNSKSQKYIGKPKKSQIMNKEYFDRFNFNNNILNYNNRFKSNERNNQNIDNKNIYNLNKTITIYTKNNNINKQNININNRKLNNINRRQLNNIKRNINITSNISNLKKIVLPISNINNYMNTPNNYNNMNNFCNNSFINNTKNNYNFNIINNNSISPSFTRRRIYNINSQQDLFNKNININ